MHWSVSRDAAMSVRSRAPATFTRSPATPFPTTAASPRSLEAVLACGASVGVAGNTPRVAKASRTMTSYVVDRGYWATKDHRVYDVVVLFEGRPVAVVGFTEGRQTNGALFWQIPDDERTEHNNNKPEILDLARSYARLDTGWQLLSSGGA